jgi:hypothetical protein
MLRHLPDEVAAVRVRHPVLGFDAFFRGNSRVEPRLHPGVVEFGHRGILSKTIRIYGPIPGF